MKAIVQDAYGSAEVLRLEEVDTPAPREGQVLVRVRAAGVDRGVWHTMTGRPYLIRMMGLRRPRQRLVGMDLAGIVEAVGTGVTRFQPGDEVFGDCQGSFAEYACAREDKIATKPSDLSFAQAAAVPVSALTALQGLRDQGGVETDQTVLILGASGGVGTFAVQIAKALGAQVTGVCSTAKLDLVRSLGADDVVDYTREDVTDGRRQWDMILDIGGNRSLLRLRRALAPGGTLVIVGGEQGGPILGGVDRLLRAMLLSPFVSHNLRGFIASVRQSDLEYLKELIEAGRLTPVIDRTFPLADAAEALRRLEQGHVRGKLVLTV